jgi:hypothetical protein
MKFVGLIIGSFAIVFMALASIHFWGLGQPYIAYENKFFEAKTPWVIVPWEQNFFLEQKNDLVLWANVYVSQAGVPLVAPSTEKVLKSRDREQSSSPARPLLSDLLKRFPNQRFILNVVDNVEGIQLQIAKALETEQKAERIMIQSDFNNVINSARELLPRMVFGSTPSDTMRLKSFEALGIVTACPFKGDVFLSSLIVSKRRTLNEKISQELHRRFKKIVLGPLKDIDEAQQALSLGADGLYTEKPEWLLQWLRDKN